MIQFVIQNLPYMVVGIGGLAVAVTWLRRLGKARTADMLPWSYPFLLTIALLGWVLVGRVFYLRLYLDDGTGVTIADIVFLILIPVAWAYCIFVVIMQRRRVRTLGKARQLLLDQDVQPDRVEPVLFKVDKMVDPEQAKFVVRPDEIVILSPTSFVRDIKKHYDLDGLMSRPSTTHRDALLKIKAILGVFGVLHGGFKWLGTTRSEAYAKILEESRAADVADALRFRRDGKDWFLILGEDPPGGGEDYEAHASLWSFVTSLKALRYAFSRRDIDEPREDLDIFFHAMAINARFLEAYVAMALVFDETSRKAAGDPSPFDLVRHLKHCEAIYRQRLVEFGKIGPPEYDLVQKMVAERTLPGFPMMLPRLSAHLVENGVRNGIDMPKSMTMGSPEDLERASETRQ